MTKKRRRILSVLAVVALTVSARLPFLLRADRFFNSDEAVEGLMARHVLQGEWPAYLWGQNYKGVPEVYVLAVVFPVVGSSVVTLKATTLAFFAAYAGLQFLMLDVLFSSTVAWLASLLLIACPPVLVLWSLSGNAEIVLTLLAGAVVILGVERWRATGARRPLLAASGAAGFGLWVQQYIVFYLAAVAVTGLVSVPAWRQAVRGFIQERSSSRWHRLLSHLILAIGVVYLGLGLNAYVTGGFEFSAFGAVVSAHHPQKLWRLAVLFFLGWGGLAWFGKDRAAQARTIALPLAVFLVGYGPALASFALVNGDAPIARMDLRRLVAASATIAYDMVPMLFGFKSPFTDRLPIPAVCALLIGATLLLSYAEIYRTSGTRVFHVYLISTTIIFLAGGLVVDAQSYRYLMPLYGALPAVYAVGIERAARWSRLVGAALCTALVGLFVAQQVEWYERLDPDVESRVILDCVNARHVRYGYADYWLSYKLTFLTDEQLILAPSGQLDRYPSYTNSVRASGNAPTIRRPPADSDRTSCEQVVTTGTSSIER